MAKDLMAIYRRLYRHFGPRRWWPAESDFEVCVGALLTQNTAWKNVAKAIANLKDADALDPDALRSMPIRKLEQLIRPSGYYRQKAKRLKILLAFMRGVEGGDWRTFLRKAPLAKARTALLAVHGIGSETADSILLYAAKRRIFVIDKYTTRFCRRVGIFPHEPDYATAQAHFTAQLPKRVKLYNEYHALLVALGATYCKAKPACGGCPTEAVCDARRTGAY